MEMETERMNKVVVDEEMKDGGMGGSRKVSKTELVIRFMGLVLSLTAAIVLALDKQTETVPITLTSTLPPLYIPFTAKFHYLSAFTYFVVANAVACSYGGVSLIVTLGGSNNRGLANLMIMFDLIMAAVLASANGAAAAVGVLGYQGNEHVRWNKVCNIFGKFCNLVKASVGMSLLGTLLFMFLVMIAVVRKH